MPRRQGATKPTQSTPAKLAAVSTPAPAVSTPALAVSTPSLCAMVSEERVTVGSEVRCVLGVH